MDRGDSPRLLSALAALALLLPIQAAPVTSPPPPAAPARMHYLSEVWDTDRGLPGFAVPSVTQTADGYLWVATVEALTRFDGVRFLPITSRNSPGYPGMFSSFTYLDRSGRLWAGTDAGIACYEHGRWREYTTPGGDHIKTPHSFAEDRQGHVFAGLYNRLYRTGGGHLIGVPVPSNLRNMRVHRDAQGDVWISALSYFGRWTGAGWQPVRLPTAMLEGEGHLEGAGPARDGGFWLAGPDRVYKYKDGLWTTAFLAPPGFQFTRVVRFLEDSSGNLWVGDHSRGLLQFRKNRQMLRFGPADGIHGHAILSIFEDVEHNVWVGTDGGGLVRLRPRWAQVFDETGGLNYAVVDSLAEQAPGRLLVGSYGGGLQTFDLAAMTFGPALEAPGLRRSGRYSEVLALLRSRDGSVWATVSESGLFRIRGSQVQHVVAPQFDGELLRCLYDDRQGTLWIGGMGGLASYDGTAVTVYHDEDGLPEDRVWAIAEDAQGTLWVGGSAGLFRREGTRFKRFLPPGPGTYGPVTALHPGSDGWLWIGVSGRGLDRWRNGVLNSYGPSHGLPDSAIAAILEDAQNRLWIATSTQGLACVTRPSFDAVAAGTQVRLDLIAVKKEDGLPTNQFRTGHQPSFVQARDGRIWFATLKGMALVDPARIQPNPRIPPVRIEQAEFGGRQHFPAHGGTFELTLPRGGRRLALSFSALSYTAPERVRFQYRLDGLDTKWNSTAERTVSFGELHPGRYVFRVRAANNDGVWNWEGASLRIHVPPSPWETTWFQTLAVVLLVLAAGGGVYLWLDRRLRQRTAQLEKEKALSRELALSEKRFATAFNSSPLPMAITALDGHYIDANTTWLEAYGRAKQDVIGRTREELGIWANPAELADFLEEIRTKGRVRSREICLNLREGPPRRHLISSEVIELDGKPCILSVAEDVTERRTMQEQLRQAQNLESVGRLAGGIAHDFNNLLTVINGYSEMMLQEPGPDDRDKLGMIHRAGERAAQLTQQLLAFSRKQVIDPRDVALNELVREAEKMLSRVLPENIEIVTRLDSTPHHVRADPGQLHRVLINLALNARDAMPAGGILVLETSRAVLDEEYCAHHTGVTPGEYVLLAVSDSGEGMEAAVRERIFEPFFTTKAPGKGTGLGLATVYGVVRQSGGWIWVYSEPGKGTTFKIYIPRATPSASAPARPSQEAAAGGGHETVLLVEDQDGVRSFERRVLERAGYRVLEAANGAAALELSARTAGPVHLLLTDVVMPGISGKELAERLVRERPATKVLYLSGYTEDAIVHQGVLEPGIAFLSKPVSPAELLAKVRETLGAAAEQERDASAG